MVFRTTKNYINYKDGLAFFIPNPSLYIYHIIAQKYISISLHYITPYVAIRFIRKSLYLILAPYKLDFVTNYLTVLLTRLLQFKVLESRYCSEEIFSFIRDYRVAKISDRKYMNLARNCIFIKDLTKKTGLPLTSYFLSNGQIKKMLSHRF